MNPWMYALSFWLTALGADETQARDRDRVVAANTPRVAHPSPSTDSPWIRHVVQRRETLEQVASRFAVKPTEILDRRREPLANRPLRPGMVLWIPSSQRPQPRQRRRLWVAQRSSWSELATAYSTAEHPLEPTRLREENPRFGRWNTVPGRQWISVWADSGVVGNATPTDPVAQIRVDAPAPGLSVGRPQVGRIKRAVQLVDGPGFEVLFPDAAWGTSLTIETVRIGIARFRDRSGYAGTLQVGAISHRKGGKFPPHRSHQSGRDVDIRLPPMPFAQGKMHLRPDEIDWHAAWLLLQTFFDTGQVQAVFLDQKHHRRIVRSGIRLGATDEGIDAVMARVMHAPGHKGHLHLRIRCSPDNERCKG